MKNTIKHNFYKPEPSDDILDSISKYANNFDSLDEKLDVIVPNLNVYLQKGKTYTGGQKIWNSNPDVGDYVGWVNLRSGVYAPEWTPNTAFNVGDIICPVVNNGHYYRCIEAGTSSPLEPTFTTTSGSEVEDIKNITFWSPSTVYKVGDIVRRVAGDKNYFYQCIIAGTSSPTQPSWIDTQGVTIVDGTVTWYVYKTVKWKEFGISCEFRPFGKVY